MDPAQLLRRAAHAHRDRIAVAAGAEQQTYGEMFERACRLATALRGLGVRPGDPVAVLGKDSVHSIEQVAACALGNFPRASLYTYHSAEVNAYLLRLVGARALVVEAERWADLRPHLVGELASLPVLVTGTDDPGGPALSYEAAVRSAPPDDVVVPVADDDVHIIRFSSGTTGRPKGIFHTVGRWAEFTHEYRWVTPLTDENSAYLVLGSLAHFGVALLWSVLPVGGRIVLQPAFDPHEALDLIEAHRITHVSTIPVMIKAMVEAAPRERDLSSLRCVLYAGSPIAERTLRSALELFGDVLYQVYAQSEVLLITTLPPHLHGGEDGRRLRSAGRATPHTVVTIRDADGSCLPPGEVGEVAALSPGAMSGIWRDEAETSARTLPDGSILTRDMGYLDAEGLLHLVDRKGDMIVSGGYNIWPSELEVVLQEHPDVAEVCVVGVPDQRWGETPKALVVARGTTPPPAADLIALTRDRVGPVKKITSVEFVAELPKSGAGKVLRKQLRDRFWASADAVRVAGV
ncbi:class I adenylate-forming enzyme family protein [Pseudonocardia halophobica]|uniref:class I adenylate-forming enzyme family protein n=1 Tax=Pseudonocardia halophobica TaxID=29401 RepID=UPI003D8C1ABB